MKEPKDHNIELHVLGGMMNGNEPLYEALANIDVEYFAHDETRRIFTWIAELSEGERVTASMLRKKAIDTKHRSIVDMADKMYTDVDAFLLDLEKLKNVYLHRRLYETSNKALLGIENKEDPKKIIRFVEDSISSFYMQDKGENMVHAKDEAMEGLQEFIDGLDQTGLQNGMAFSVDIGGKLFGFPDLDATFKGAQGGDAFILAAKTGEGKTSFACNIVRIFSILQNYKGYYLNMEMKRKELRSRIVAPIAMVTVDELSESQPTGTKEEREQKIRMVSAAFNKFSKAPLLLSRIPTLDANKVKSLAKQAKARHGLDYLIVDYLGRLEGERSWGTQEYQMMAHNMKKMKELAVELDIPVFVLAQRNFDGELEGAKKIANEADGVLFLQPIDEDDEKELQEKFNNEQRYRVNYKIVKKKVRRSDKIKPIYVQFDKPRQLINEVR